MNDSFLFIHCTTNIWTPYFQVCLSFDKRYVAKMQNCHAKCLYFLIQYIIANFKCISSIVVTARILPILTINWIFLDKRDKNRNCRKLCNLTLYFFGSYAFECGIIDIQIQFFSTLVNNTTS